MDTNTDHTVILRHTKTVKMSHITQKDLYEDAILKTTTDHPYQTKWAAKLQTPILWEEVWNTVHNILMSNKTKTIIWEQLHLNFYTQYSYNKWHKVNNKCPLCGTIPESIYHTILDCKFVKDVWLQAQPFLLLLHNRPITDEEKALGIVNLNSTPGIMLRNWITFKLREQIMLFERKVSRSTRFTSFKAKFKQVMALEITQHFFRLKKDGNLPFIEKVVASGNSM